MSEPEIDLLKGPMPKLDKMKAKDIKIECEMWRNLWGWVPPEVKYYLARIGQQIGIVTTNYQRYLGTLIDTHWTLDELELGLVEKVHDTIEDRWYYEKKVIKMKQRSVLGVQWIKERISEQEFEAKLQEEEKKEEDAEKKDVLTGGE